MPEGTRLHAHKATHAATTIATDARVYVLNRSILTNWRTAQPLFVGLLLAGNLVNIGVAHDHDIF